MKIMIMIATTGCTNRNLYYHQMIPRFIIFKLRSWLSSHVR